MSVGPDGTSGEPGNYEYVIARVRSRRAALFDDDDYRKLVRMGTGEIARFMEDTEYEAEMAALGARHEGADLVEYALNRNLAKHFEDLLRWADGRLYDLLVRYLRKFDVWNVKTLLRGVYAEAGEDAITEDLIRAGELEDDLLDRLAATDSVEAVVDGLADTVFGDELAAAYEDFEAEGVLVPLENAVDRAYYDLLVDGLPTDPDPDSPTGLYVDFLTAEIDFRNLRNALRLARSGADLDPSAYYIAGGRLFDADSIDQLATDRDQLVTHVRDSTYGDELDQALEDLADADSLVEFERALEAALLAYGDTLSRKYPLSVCPVLAFVLAKEREVDNVRAITRGREAGLSPEEIEAELVIG